MFLSARPTTMAVIQPLDFATNGVALTGRRHDYPLINCAPHNIAYIAMHSRRVQSESNNARKSRRSSEDQQSQYRSDHQGGRYSTKAAQAIAAEMADYSKRSFESSTKAMKKPSGVKSLVKAIEVQSEYAKAFFEDYTAQVTKLGQLYADLAKNAFKPFEAQITKASQSK